MSDVMRVKDRRRAGWFYVDNAVLEDYGPQIGAAGIAVYCAIALHCAGTDRSAHPSHAHIAKLVGLSRRKVIDVLNKLRDVGLIDIKQRFGANKAGGRRQLPSDYTLKPVKCAATVHVVHSGQCAQTSVHHVHTQQYPMGTIPNNNKRASKRQRAVVVEPKNLSADSRRILDALAPFSVVPNKRACQIAESLAARGVCADQARAVAKPIADGGGRAGAIILALEAHDFAARVIERESAPATAGAPMEL